MKIPKISPKKTEVFKLAVEQFHFLKYKKFFHFLNSASYSLKHKNEKNWGGGGGGGVRGRIPEL